MNNFRFHIPRFIYCIINKIIDFYHQKSYFFNSESYYPPLRIKAYKEGNRVIIGSNSYTMDSNVCFYGSDARLVIGKNCIIKNVKFWFEGNGGLVEIGNNVTIEEANISVVDQKYVKIGDDSMISSGVTITTTDSHSIVDFKGNRQNPDKDIEIGSHVWLGANVKVLKGVSIGEHSIIGTESLVTKSVPCYSLAAGIPAKVIRLNVDWRRERI